MVRGNEARTKKWEPKKEVQFQTNEAAKEIVQEKGSSSDATKKLVVPIAPKVFLPSMIMKSTVTGSLDMLSMLS